ncbi:MAG: deoxyribose-phosphate aldolase [Eubacteriales bacterium]|nr:deoxyribose-phosphate aldolase [Eubacteriales bacterium]MDD4389903.1 deoxyribose-phosphate aldolase [Eubacteriales bacterium]
MYKPLNKYFDHTLLTPDATTQDIKRICDEAVVYDFYAVCVNGSNVGQAAESLKDTGIKVAAVIGFPLGASTLEVKTFEAADCCENGADEIDMVINIGRLKEGRYEDVKDDIAAVVSAAEEYGAIVKVILETALLTEDEIKTACELSLSAGAEFVKTCTGFKGSANAQHVSLMNACVGNLAKVKASGGIRKLDSCIEMINAGADRIGSSSSVAIMEEYKQTIR